VPAGSGGMSFALWSLAGSAASTLIVFFVHRRLPGPGPQGRLGIADGITIARLVLIAPTVWLVAHRLYAPAALCYCALIVTDIADGIVARKRRETSIFGVIMDPTADILSTYAVFTTFMIDGLVPVWLQVLLTFRYLMLCGGSLFLARVVGPIEFRSTLPGKIVGVVQAAGVLWILGAAALGRVPTPASGPLFAFLALGFVSIVVSQALIGYRHVRRARTRARG
jgi:phosphatidylglycerophosphate synthase